MSENGNHEVDDDKFVGGSSMNSEVRALIGEIADLREKAKEDHYLDLAIPGTRDLLWVRYRPFPAAKTERKADQLRRLADRGQPIMLRAACESLIDACEQVMVLPARFEGEIGVDGQNLVPLDDTIPIRFEKRLADLFVKNPDELSHITTAMDVVMAMFPTEQAIIAQNVEVSTWMQDVTRNIDSALVGE